MTKACAVASATQEDAALEPGRRHAREADDEKAAEHGAEDAGVAPRQRVAQAAAQHDRDAQHQPVRVRSPRQREAEVVRGRERERHAHGMTQDQRIAPEMRAQRAQRPAFGRDERLQLQRRERQRLDLAAQQRVDAGDVDEQAIDAALQHRQEASARVVGGHLQLVDGGGNLERRVHRAARGAAVAQGVAGLVEMVGDAAQRPRGSLEDLATGVVAAEQVDIEAARQQRVAQVDQAQQDGDVALPVAGVNGGVEEVACCLQPLGERRLAADPGADRRRFAGRDAIGDAGRARASERARPRRAGRRRRRGVR